MIFSRRFILLFSVWWLLWSAFQFYVLRCYGVPANQALADAAISNILLAAFCLGMNVMLRFYRPGDKNTIYLLLWVLADAAASAWLVKETILHLTLPDAAYEEWLSKSLPVRFAINLLLIGLFLLAGWVRYFLNQKQEVENRRLELENISRKAELLTLRQQLQPHFLFNTLNSISALAGTRSDEARRMIQQLSDFLRGTLNKDDTTLLPLREELCHLHLYLEIEKVRFGHRLKTDIICTEAGKELLLPALLLQPLVENAIKFGLYDTLDEVIIQIHASCQSNELQIEITNPFDTQTAGSQKGTGFGIASVKRRLYLLFGRSDLLTTHITANLFSVTLKIPQHECTKP